MQIRTIFIMSNANTIELLWLSCQRFFHLVLKFGTSGQYARFASPRFKSPLSEERLFGDQSHFSLQNHEIFSWLIGWLQFQREFPITKNKFMETAFDFLPS